MNTLAADLPAAAGTARRGTLPVFHTAVWLLVLALAFLFLYPMAVAIWRLVQDFDAGSSALAAGSIGSALPKVLLNTAIVVGGSTVLALVAGALIAWVNERTDARLGLAGELLPLSSLLLPPIAGVIGWAVLLDPRAGLLNHALRGAFGWIGIAVDSGPLNIYTFGGLIVITAFYKVPYVFLVISAALRQVDPAMEEASRVAGAGPAKTLLRVTLPAIRPALAAAVLLGIITGISQFSVPLVLGAGARVDVLSVFIYRLLSTYPPQTAPALLLAGGMLVLVQLLLVAQRWIAPAGRNAAIAGRGFRNAALTLGRWRRPVKWLVVAYLIATAVLPIAGLIFVSLQPFWTPIINWKVLSLNNFMEVIVNNRLTTRGLTNSLMLGVATATLCMLVAGVVMLHFQQSKRAGRRFADGVMSLPATLPHTVIGVAFLLAFSVTPFRLYGTVAILLLAYVCIALPFAARAASSAASSIGHELGEASRVAGAGETKTIRRILFPLALPGLIAGWIIVFIHTVGEVTASALLAGTGNPAIGRVLMELWTFGSFPQVAALALVITTISAALVGVMLVVSRRSVASTLS